MDYEISNMNNALRNNFPPFQSEQELRLAVESVCARFGKVKSLKISPASRGIYLQCACVLQLDSAAAEKALRSKLHVLKVAGSLYFFADVSDAWSGLTTQQLKQQSN